MTEPATQSLLITRIVIERHIDADGSDSVTAEFEDSNGDMPSLVEVLGMLELTKDSAIRASMHDCDEDDCDE